MVYVALGPSDPGCVVRTEEFGRVRIDFDAAGEVYGIEIEGDLGPVELTDAPLVTFNSESHDG